MTSAPAVGRPGKVVVVLLDSLNRHMLGAYGGDEFDTPNLDRFSATSTVFERHHVGSLPCLPARHDLLVGWIAFQIFAQISLFEWIGDRIDNLTDDTGTVAAAVGAVAGGVTPAQSIP